MGLSIKELNEYFVKFVQGVKDYVEKVLPYFYFSDTYWTTDRQSCTYKSSLFLYHFDDNKIIANKQNNVVTIEIEVRASFYSASKNQTAYHTIYAEPKMLLGFVGAGWYYPCKDQDFAERIEDIVKAKTFQFFKTTVEVEQDDKYGLVAKIRLNLPRSNPQDNGEFLYIYTDRPFNLPSPEEAVKELIADWLTDRAKDFDEIAALFEDIESLY